METVSQLFLKEKYGRHFRERESFPEKADQIDRLEIVFPSKLICPSPGLGAESAFEFPV